MLSPEKVSDLEESEQQHKLSKNILEIWKNPKKRAAAILLAGAAMDSVFGTMKDGVEAINAFQQHPETVSISQPVESSYLSADPTNTGVFVSQSKDHHIDDRSKYHTGEGGSGAESAPEDMAKWLDFSESMAKDPMPMDPGSLPSLPEDFPTYKLPIPITENTPRDAVQRDLVG